MAKNLFKYALLSIALCNTVFVSDNGYTSSNIKTPNAGLQNIGATCYRNATL